jgi:inosine-uridine nucleoside N-ribohydrolase
LQGRRKILIDTDIAFGSRNADVDDVLSILLALAEPSLDVVAITPVGGNVSVDKASNNLHKFLSRIGRASIPHAWSSARPLDPYLKIKAERWDKAPMENIVKALDAPEVDSVDLILKTIREASEPLTLMTIGPLTNVGLALAKEPGAAAGIGEIVMMGGSFRKPGIHGYAEFNIWADPYAAAIVFNSGIPIAMFGLDVTKKRKVRPADIEPWNLPGSPLVTELYGSYLDYMRYRSELYGEPEPFAFFHDAFPMAYLVKPEMFSLKPCRIEVDLDGELNYAATLVDFGTTPRSGAVVNHKIALDVDDAALLEYVLFTVTREWEGAE